EAMGERQITVGSVTYPLPELFMVMATQNPIEQEGTYPLPEAQLDRFLLHVLIGYPDAAGERAILELNRAEQKRAVSDKVLFTAPEVLTQREVLAARLEVLDRHLSDPLREYIVQVVLATREPARDDRARPLRASARVAYGPRLRDARGRPRDRPRRAAASDPARVRGRGVGPHARRARRHVAAPDRGPVVAMATPARAPQSPVRVTLADLMRLRAAGEAVRLTAPRVRVAASGGHLSPYKGRGVEFDESRLYQPGDDLRTIDWRVTARTGKPHTKVFRE